VTIVAHQMEYRRLRGIAAAADRPAARGGRRSSQLQIAALDTALSKGARDVDRKPSARGLGWMNEWGI